MDENNYNDNAQNEKKYNGIAIAGFVVSLASLLINFAGIVGLVGTILSIIGLNQTKDNSKKGKGLAIAGLIVGIFSIVYGIFSIIRAVMILGSIF